MLLFDFDGVLIDSLNEVIVTAYNLVTGSLHDSLSGVPAEVALLFRRNRFHVQPAGDLVILMEWSIATYRKNPSALLSDEQFDALVLPRSASLKERTADFFATRRRLVEKDERTWVSLNAPYYPLWDALVEFGAERIVIVTNKNKEATLRLCNAFGLGVLPEHIYSGDGGATKTENLHAVCRRYSGPHAFLEDSVRNLTEVTAHFRESHDRIDPILASWGYIGPRDLSEAGALGITVVDQEQAINILRQERGQ